MCRLVTRVVAVVAVAGASAWGQAVTGPWETWEHGKGPLSLPLQPQFEKLVNRPSCVYGFCTNLDWHWPDPVIAVTPSAYFFFRGDTKGLNEFLEAFSRLKDEKLVLIIRAGRAPPESRRGSREEFPYDWKMVWDGQVRKRPEGDHLEHFVRSAEVWLGGNVKLDELRVPPSIEVQSGGEIEKFIREHETARKKIGAAADAGKPPATAAASRPRVGRIVGGEHTSRFGLDDVEFSYTGVREEYARAMARLVSIARRAAIEEFGLDMPETLHVAVKVNPKALGGEERGDVD